MALVAVGLAGLSLAGSATGYSLAGRVFLTLWAVGSLTAATFRMDVPGAPATTAGVLHGWAGLNFVLGIVAALVIGRALRRAGRTDLGARRAQTSAWLLAASGIALVVFMGPLRGLDLGGLAQRIYWVMFLAWLISAQIAIVAPRRPTPAPRHG